MTRNERVSGSGTRGRLSVRPLAQITLAVSILAMLAGFSPSSRSAPGDGVSGWATPHHGDGRVVLSKRLRMKGPQARMYRLGHGAGEPTLGITGQGNIFVTASAGCVTRCFGSTEMARTVTPGERAVFTSPDEGQTWVDVTPKAGDEVPTHVLSMDPYLYVDERTSRVFNIDLTVACSILSYSDDLGKTWISNPWACGEPVNDHQTVFAGPPVSSQPIGYENLVYYCFNHPAFTKCAKSLDGGITWIPTTNVIPECSGTNGHGIVGKDGTVYLPLRSSCDSAPMLFISQDEGDTWEVVRTAKHEASMSGDPSVALDEDGNLYYLFVDSATHLPFLTVSKDEGRTWTNPIQVAAPGVTESSLATLDVGDPGKIAIAYYGRTEPGRWNGYLAIGRALLSKAPFFYSAPINDPSEPLKVGSCYGDCGRVLDFIDVEIAPDGQAWGAYVDACATACEATGEENISDNEGVLGSLVGGFRLR